jgi:hypothetical protein
VIYLGHIPALCSEYISQLTIDFPSISLFLTEIESNSTTPDTLFLLLVGNSIPNPDIKTLSPIS